MYGMNLKPVEWLSELKVGDWVVIEQREDYYKGFVVKKNAERFWFFCTSKREKKDKEFLTVNRNYGDFHTRSDGYSVHLYLSDEEAESDKKHLIDIALATGDQDWFKELVG